MIKVPWTAEQVEALNRVQGDPRLHPYTCPGDNGVLCADRLLLATPDGWVCNCGRYTQDWALTPTLEYPEHSDRHRPFEYLVRMEYDPGPGPLSRLDLFILACVEHQVTLAMLLWLLILTGVMIWWMA